MSNEDRPKRSWREIDQMRDKARSRDDRERRPVGRAAEARAQQATQAYLKEADKLFSAAKGGAEGDRLSKAIRDAHGSPELAGACREYRETLGVPDDPSLLALFLDTDESELVVVALDALLQLKAGERLEISKGLRSQLRVLEQSFEDPIAGRAEELLEGV